MSYLVSLTGKTARFSVPQLGNLGYYSGKNKGRIEARKTTMKFHLGFVLAVFSIACLAVPISRAQTETGNTIQEKCKALNESTDKFKAGFCAGFVSTSQEMLLLWHAVDEGLIRKHPTSAQVCFPAEVTNGQLVKVFLKYLDEHPESLHEPATGLFIKAMQQAFSCKIRS